MIKARHYLHVPHFFKIKNIRRILRPAWSFIKKRLQQKSFHVNFSKFLRTPILQDICERLLLKLLRKLLQNLMKLAFSYFFLLIFTLSWRMSLSYRNQSIDLQSKSVDWFLYMETSVMKEFMELFRNSRSEVLFEKLDQENFASKVLNLGF